MTEHRTAPTTVLELDRVWRVHGRGHTAVEALREASLRVEAGELVAIMGPSGSGKSTLLTLAGGLDRPTEGEVRVLGQELSRLGPDDLAKLRRRSIGYVFQDLNLLPGLTAAENVSLPLELEGQRPGPARDAALAALERVRLADLADRFPEDLSGGEQQRVAIARAVVGERRLLLADEPTGALDSVTGEAVLRLLRGACDDGAAGVLVTHDAAHAAWADRVVFIRDGVIVDQAGPVDGPESLLADEVGR
ncbi:ABC transporter ATP-binding protein [Nitriliruptoraceae bacterium ZYF776]|nr:ABC transporter ATP-binding protein [Profundirhabdus halotolerans]